jgi:hypothetical protein
LENSTSEEEISYNEGQSVLLFFLSTFGLLKYADTKRSKTTTTTTTTMDAGNGVLWQLYCSHEHFFYNRTTST